ncbi:MAG: hypothetical protein QOG45_1308, partial [Chloroflexota bacterium]|nr:hypothetical protein [Chloroflexota bacterium]
MTISRSTAVALAGTALMGLLAACGSAGASSAGYVPLSPSASATPAPAVVDPAQAPAQVAPAVAPPAAAGTPGTVVAPQAPATDFSGLARRFVALRNTG